MIYFLNSILLFFFRINFLVFHKKLITTSWKLSSEFRNYLAHFLTPASKFFPEMFFCKKTRLEKISYIFPMKILFLVFNPSLKMFPWKSFVYLGAIFSPNFLYFFQKIIHPKQFPNTFWRKFFPYFRMTADEGLK